VCSEGSYLDPQIDFLDLLTVHDLVRVTDADDLAEIENQQPFDHAVRACSTCSIQMIVTPRAWIALIVSISDAFGVGQPARDLVKQRSLGWVAIARAISSRLRCKQRQTTRRFVGDRNQLGLLEDHRTGVLTSR
jgi:hypothetical protein